MNGMNNKRLLSICIPIYNRIQYLERQLERFLEDKDLFAEQIQLIISDNCSAEDLRSCCEKYQQKGLELFYNRNERNLGADGNFDWCFHHAEGKYVWLLGSDDIPVKEFLRKLIGYLNSGEYGLVHLTPQKRKQEFNLFTSTDKMAIEVNYWITFMSANIILTNTLKSINLTDYKNTSLIQVPAYLNACCSCQNNAIIYLPKYFDENTDFANNGGYNIFQVFVTNLYGIYGNFVSNKKLSKRAFNKIIKIEYKYFLVGFIIRLLVLKENSNFKIDNAWSILWKYYSFKPYFYWYLLIGFVKRVVSLIIPSRTI